MRYFDSRDMPLSLDHGLASGALPPGFPPWRTVHEYFTQWTLTRGGEQSLLERALEQIGRPAAIEQMRKRIGERSELPP